MVNEIILRGIFLQKCRPLESNNTIFILPTDRPYLFAVLPVDQNINLVSPSIRVVEITLLIIITVEIILLKIIMTINNNYNKNNNNQTN